MSKSAKRDKSKKSESGSAPVEPTIKNGWKLYAHPAFLGQLERVAAKALADRNPQSAATKVTAWLTRAIFDEIPQDPSKSNYRLGGALNGVTHWFRDKYAGRFRLFFRYNSKAKIIIYGWVNDEQTLRTYGSKTDAYAVFKDRLGQGDPPDSWEALLVEASTLNAVTRLKRNEPKDRI